MAGVLTVASSASPFPYAAVAIATYTQKVEVTFDEGVSGVSLDLNGSKVTDEAEAVRAIAKAGGLADDSAKVRVARRRQSCQLIKYRNLNRRKNSSSWRRSSPP